MDVTEFYLACRDGDVQLVEWLLPSFSLAEVDRLESDGSTALHAASSNGHSRTVSLLLEKGASRRLPNIFNATPVDEANGPEIKQLFNRPANKASNRFTTDSPATEWMLTDWRFAYYFYKVFCFLGDKEVFKSLSKKIGTAEVLNDVRGLAQIMYLLQQAAEKKDATYLLKAYTAETDFYRLLNLSLSNYALNIKDNACVVSFDEANNQPWHLDFAKCIFRDPINSKYLCKGTSYRGMYVTKEDLDPYSVRANIISKSCLSTSKLRSIAEHFIAQTPTPGKQRAICSYKIENEQHALDLQSISEFPTEQEILIRPGTWFSVISIESNCDPIEIKLEQQAYGPNIGGAIEFSSNGVTFSCANRSEDTF